ncbi:MAG TPA: hypothetical protein VII06_25185 [Chloroflexota bacterium]
MRQYVVRSARRLGPSLDLALISFVALYFEMIAIRWLASDVRVFAYLKNLPLLAAFLGLGLGCASAGTAAGRARGGIQWFPPLCLAFAAVVACAEPLGLVHLYFPQTDFWAWNDANFEAQQLPETLLAVRFFAVVLALFLLVVALFASLGARLGTLFDALPPTRAYSVNLAASLAGIWVFAALSWLGWPPVGWFALGFLAVARFFVAGRPNPASPPSLRRKGGAGGWLGRWSFFVSADGRDGLGRSWGRFLPGSDGRSGLGQRRPAPPPSAEWTPGPANRRRSLYSHPLAEASASTPGPPFPRREGGWGVRLAPGLLAVACLGATLVVTALAPGATRWSPYYRIDLSPYLVPNLAGGLDPAGQKLTVNHDYHQNALNLGDAFVRAHPDLETPHLAYELPYRFVGEPQRVLVVGAGMGNDVAAALRHNAQRVDAVEIDPAILGLGRELHPERPFGSPRVRAINDDARAYLARTDEQYDLIVFGLLDSHTLLSSLSSLRLDSYVYTLESLQQARAHLAPGGHLALSFSASLSDSDWMAARLYQMVAAAFEEEPVALSLGYDVSTLYVAGPGAHERLAEDPELAALAVDPVALREPVAPATDDWPFLYLREHSLPLLPYGVMLALVLVAGGGLVLLTLRQSGDGGLDAPMFLLGAAFMLLETKSVTQLSLLFGSTWLVNAVVISAILALALGANLYVGWRRVARVGPAYGLLALALLMDQVVPLGALGGLDAPLRAALGSLLLALPLLFAGVVFAILFARSSAPSRAIGSNLLGALAGGLLEYASMISGFGALGLLALGLYAGSWLALRRRPLLARARRTRLARAARPLPR